MAVGAHLWMKRTYRIRHIHYQDVGFLHAQDCTFKFGVLYHVCDVAAARCPSLMGAGMSSTFSVGNVGVF